MPPGGAGGAGLPPPAELVQGDRLAHQLAFAGRNPWWASSRVSVATLGESRLRLGPVHRTGMTPSRLQVATTVPVAGHARDVRRLGGLTPVDMLDSQAVTLVVSLHTGRVSLMLRVLQPGRQLPDEVVVAALLALLEDDLDAETLAAVEGTEGHVVDA